MKNRQILLNNWLYQVLTDNEDILQHKDGVIGMYSQLQDEFLKDAQKTMRNIAREIFIKRAEKGTK